MLIRDCYICEVRFSRQNIALHDALLLGMSNVSPWLNRWLTIDTRALRLFSVKNVLRKREFFAAFIMFVCIYYCTVPEYACACVWAMVGFRSGTAHVGGVRTKTAIFFRGQFCASSSPRGKNELEFDLFIESLPPRSFRPECRRSQRPRRVRVYYSTADDVRLFTNRTNYHNGFFLRFVNVRRGSFIYAVFTIWSREGRPRRYGKKSCRISRHHTVVHQFTPSH